VGAEDDHVSGLCGCRFEDGFGWVAFPNEECRADTGLAGLVDDRQSALLDPGPLLIDSPQERAAGQAEPARVDDADDDRWASCLSASWMASSAALAETVVRSVARSTRWIGLESSTFRMIASTAGSDE
jgi:hypothetical protein